MKIIQYLSPTSISLFYADIKEFYLNYLCEERPPRPPQTKPMSVGSSFDAYVKNYLYENLFGIGHDPKYDFQNLFEAQVESQNRDFAKEAGDYIFDCYKKTGALGDLMLELESSIGTPRFEIEIKGIVDGYKEGVTKNIKGVVFLGKPDLFYINKNGSHVILDWKVNGYCGNYNTVPMKGYIKLRNPNNRTHGQHHKDAHIFYHKGTLINIAHYLENLDYGWAQQLSIYAWLLGCAVGEEFIASIDQVCCNGAQRDEYNRPDLRFAEHRLRVHSDSQYMMFANAEHVWEVVHSNWIFRTMTEEQSQEHCQQLDDIANSLKGDGTTNDKWFNQVSRF